MGINRPSNQSIDHFDRSTRIISPDFDWDEMDCGAPEFDPAAEADATSPGDALDVEVTQHHRTQSLPHAPPAATITAGCVLQWTAAAVVFVTATKVLLAFSEQVAAEHALDVAAQAGAFEATLPKASYESVFQTVERRLASFPEVEKWNLTLMQNDVPVLRHIERTEGDAFSLTLSAQLRSWLPFATRETKLVEARAQSRRPGRKMAAVNRVSENW